MSKKKSKGATAARAVAGEIVGRFGNFIVRRVFYADAEYLRISTAEGGWREDFRSDTMRYGWIMAALSDARCHHGLEAWIILHYHTAQALIDEAFLDGLLRELNALWERNTAEYEAHTEGVTVEESEMMPAAVAEDMGLGKEMA